MRSNNTLVSGVFCGAVLEPGTFHLFLGSRPIVPSPFQGESESAPASSSPTPSTTATSQPAKPDAEAPMPPVQR